MPKQLFRRDVTGQEKAMERAGEQRRSSITVGEPEHLLTPQALALGDIPLDVIVPNPFQARKSFDAVKLQELADSIIEHGFITRIRVRPSPYNEDIFELVYGERRWRAARMAGLTSLPCEIVPYTDEELTEIGLIENVQRDDLVPSEEAEMYQRLLEQKDEGGKQKYSIRSLAKRIGKDKGYVEARLALLRAPEDVQQLLKDQPDVPLRVARELIKVPTAEERAPIIKQVRSGTLRTEDVRAIVKQHAQVQAPVVSLEQEAVTTRTSEPLPPTGAVVPPEDTRTTAVQAAALLVFERTLQRDHESIQRVFEHLLQDAVAMTATEKKLVYDHVLLWEHLLEEIKAHVV